MNAQDAHPLRRGTQALLIIVSILSLFPASAVGGWPPDAADLSFGWAHVSRLAKGGDFNFSVEVLPSPGAPCAGFARGAFDFSTDCHNSFEAISHFRF
jgi:hypothetical protein